MRLLAVAVAVLAISGMPPSHAVTVPGVGIGPGLLLSSIDTTRSVSATACTAGFVFVKSGTYGLATAGHCGAVGADVTAFVVPPAGSGATPGFYHVGSVVLRHDNGPGDDFAVVALYPSVNSWVNPAVPVWGGPSGAYPSDDATVVKWYGHGTGAATPRAGYATVLAARGGRAFAAYGAGDTADAGAAVVSSTGLAVGILTGAVTTTDAEIAPGMLAGTRIAAILSAATGWSLVTTSPVPTP